MADASNFTSYNNVMPNISVGGAVSTFSNKRKSKSKKTYRYKVVQINPDNSIVYQDTFEQFGITNTNGNSSIETNIAYPLSQGQMIFPSGSEWVDLVFAPDPYSISNNKSNGKPRAYWNSAQGSLNIWNQSYENTSNQPISNVTLDSSVPGCVEESTLSNINVPNMQNAVNGFVI